MFFKWSLTWSSFPINSGKLNLDLGSSHRCIQCEYSLVGVSGYPKVNSQTCNTWSQITLCYILSLVMCTCTYYLGMIQQTGGEALSVLSPLWSICNCQPSKVSGGWSLWEWVYSITDEETGQLSFCSSREMLKDRFTLEQKTSERHHESICLLLGVVGIREMNRTG